MNCEETVIDGRSTVNGNWNIEDMIALGFDVCFPESEKNMELPKSLLKRCYAIPRHCFGFYDWFCNDYSLRNRAKRMYGTVKSIYRAVKKSGKFDPAQFYVSYKNCCPMSGGTYDVLRIFPVNQNDSMIFTIAWVDGHIEFYYNGEVELEQTFDGVRDLIKWFATVA